jgi:hypothetical protein
LAEVLVGQDEFAERLVEEGVSWLDGRGVQPLGEGAA